VVSAGRAAVEFLLWLGVLAGVALLLVWWDVRPGAPGAQVATAELPSRALLQGSFLLVTGATTLVVWLRGHLPVARIAAAVSGLALLLAGGPWSDIDDATYVSWALRVAGLALWGLIAVRDVWTPTTAGPRVSRAVAAGLLAVLVLPVAYALLAISAGVDTGMVSAQGEDDPGWVVAMPGFGILALALLGAAWVVRSTHWRRPHPDEV